MLSSAFVTCRELSVSRFSFVHSKSLVSLVVGPSPTPSLIQMSRCCRTSSCVGTSYSTMTLSNLRQTRRRSKSPLLRSQYVIPPTASSSWSLLRLSLATDPSSSTTETSKKTKTLNALQTPEEVQMTKDIQCIYQAAIQAVDPVNAVQNRLICIKDSSIIQVQLSDSQVRSYDLQRDYDSVVVVAFGKASAAMATAVLDIVAPAIQTQNDSNDNNDTRLSAELSGLIIAKDGHVTSQQFQQLQRYNIMVHEASHPIPDHRSVQASTELLQLVQRTASSRTLVVACISGGGSALFCCPHPQLTLNDLQVTNQILLQSGGTIQEVNVIRKRLECGKGGKFAKAAYPSHVVSLILSDVLGDPLDIIASGPTVPDTSTWQNAWEILQRLEQKLQQQQSSSQPSRTSDSSSSSFPSSVYQLLQDGASGRLSESDAPVTSNHPVFAQCVTTIVGNTATAVQAATQQAHQAGYRPYVLTTQLQGEAKDVAQILVAMAQQIRSIGSFEYSSTTTTMPSDPPRQRRVALLLGGETTVTVPPNSLGKGGRNQELALAGAIVLHQMQLRQVVMASIGTDGTDGPTDAAGGIVDGATIDRLAGNALEALQQHDAYHYLSQTDATGWSPLVKTGPTGTNVADVVIVLVHVSEDR